MHTVQAGSPRSFGLVFTIVFLLVGTSPLLKSEPPKVSFLVIAAVLALVSWLKPTILSPLNRLWFEFGLKLHVVVSFVIMFVLFFGLFLPIGFILKVLGKQPIPLKSVSKSNSYWTLRDQRADQGDTSSRDQWTDFNFQF